MSDLLELLGEMAQDRELSLQELAEPLAPAPGEVRELEPLPEIDSSPAAIQTVSRLHRMAILTAKSPEQVRMECSGMPIRDWLDFAFRAMPKEVEVKGQVQVQALVGMLGPLPSGRA